MLDEPGQSRNPHKSTQTQMQRQTVSPDRRTTLMQFSDENGWTDSDEQQREANSILSTNGFGFTIHLTANVPSSYK